MQDRNSLRETECVLARTDRIWRGEVTRRYGPDGVLIYRYQPQAHGEAGTPIRRAFDDRLRAVQAWREVRQLARSSAY